MIRDLDKSKLDELFRNVSDPNVLFEEDDIDIDNEFQHQHHHNHDLPPQSPPQS